jgi:hypothetical protein
VKNIFKFLAKLMFFSLALFLSRDIIFIVYQLIVLMSYKLIGGPRFPANTIPYDSSAWLIPLFALLLATPGISIKKRIAAILFGSVTYMLMDLSGIIIWQSPPTFNGNDESAIYRIHFLVLELFSHWLLPLGIWILAAKKEIVSLLGGLLPVPQSRSTQ